MQEPSGDVCTRRLFVVAGTSLALGTDHPIELGAAHRARALQCLASVFECNLFWILDVALLSTFDTVCLLCHAYVLLYSQV
jgi:hypothetical protein